MTGTSTRLTVHPLQGSPFGAEILGLEPDDISEDEAALVWDTYRESHGLLCFSFGRLLDAKELHTLTAMFGESEFAPGLIDGYGKKTTDGQQQLTIDDQIAELRANGVDPYLAFIGNLNPRTLETESVETKFFGEWEWHTDMSYIPVPPTFSLLHAREVPDEGGDTGFCNQVMAAQELPPALRQRVLKLSLKHGSTYGSSGVRRPGMTPPKSPIEALGHTHPILRKVPSTGDEALFLGRRTNGYIVGLPLAESEELLDKLWAHATQERFCYRHHWQVGQVVVWDNRMLMHSRQPMAENRTRFMWRTQTRGEAVVPAGTGGMN